MKILYTGTAFLIMLACFNARANPYCGELKNAYGPYDYTRRSEYPQNLTLVEGAHFTPEVENLIKGNAGTLGGDIDYTLRAIPNHHRALIAMGKLGIKLKSAQPAGAKYTVDCYFDRAMRFRPDDGMVLAAYGDYLARIGEYDKAMEKMKEAIRLVPDNASVNYNLGLLYLKRNDYANAKAYAVKAYGLGFPLPGLRKKLIEAGKWDDTAR